MWDIVLAGNPPPLGGGEMGSGSEKPRSLHPGGGGAGGPALTLAVGDGDDAAAGISCTQLVGGMGLADPYSAKKGV